MANKMDLFPKSDYAKEGCYSLTFCIKKDAASQLLKCFQHACIQYGSNNSGHYVEHLKTILDSVTLQECRYDFFDKRGSQHLFYVRWINNG